MICFIVLLFTQLLVARRNLRKPQKTAGTATCRNGLSFNPTTSNITLKEKETKNITITQSCGNRWMCNLTESPSGILDPIDSNFKINRFGPKQLKLSVNEKKLDSASGDPEKIQMTFKCKDRNNSIAFKSYSIDIEKEKVKVQLNLNGIKKLYKPLDKITITPKVTPRPTESPLKVELSLTSSSSKSLNSTQTFTINKNKTTSGKVSFDLSKINLDNDNELTLNAKLIANKDYILNYTPQKLNIKLEKITGSVLKLDKKSISKLEKLSLGERKTLKLTMSKANPNGKTVLDIKFTPENKVTIVGGLNKVIFLKNQKTAKFLIEVNDDNAKEKDKIVMNVTPEATYVPMFKKGAVDYNMEIQPMKPLQIFFKLKDSDGKVIKYGKNYRGVIKANRKIYKDKDSIPKEGAKITIKPQIKNEELNKHVEIEPKEVEIENRDYFFNSKFTFKIPKPDKFNKKIKRDILFVLNIAPKIKGLKWPRKKELSYKIEKIKKARFKVNCPFIGKEKKEMDCSIRVKDCKELDFNVVVKVNVKFDKLGFKKKEVHFKKGKMCEKKHIKFKPDDTGKIKLSFDVEGNNKKLFKEPDDKEIVIKGESKLKFTIHGLDNTKTTKKLLSEKVKLTLKYGEESKEMYLKSSDEVKNKLTIKVTENSDLIEIQNEKVEIMKGFTKSQKFKIKVKNCVKTTKNDCAKKELDIGFVLEDSLIDNRTYKTDFPELKLTINEKDKTKKITQKNKTKKITKNVDKKKKKPGKNKNKDYMAYFIALAIVLVGLYFSLREEDKVVKQTVIYQNPPNNIEENYEDQWFY
eukprot:GAHX01002186.1.p1 GENE.GAHX01002186.1~~GAHX01002186.1.p1  ORF type:complete len:805 (-),score=220.23 GAHX01002186.1:35-2449(-)